MATKAWKLVTGDAAWRLPGPGTGDASWRLPLPEKGDASWRLGLPKGSKAAEDAGGASAHRAP